MREKQRKRFFVYYALCFGELEIALNVHAQFIEEYLFHLFLSRLHRRCAYEMQPIPQFSHLLIKHRIIRALPHHTLIDAFAHRTIFTSIQKYSVSELSRRDHSMCLSLLSEYAMHITGTQAAGKC